MNVGQGSNNQSTKKSASLVQFWQFWVINSCTRNYSLTLVIDCWLKNNCKLMQRIQVILVWESGRRWIAGSDDWPPWLRRLAGLQTRFYFLTSRRMKFSGSLVNQGETLVGWWVHHTHPDTAPLHLSARLVHRDHSVSFHFIPGATRASLSVPPNHQGNITAATFPPTVLPGSTFKSCMASNQQITSHQIDPFSSKSNPWISNYAYYLPNFSPVGSSESCQHFHLEQTDEFLMLTNRGQHLKICLIVKQPKLALKINISISGPYKMFSAWTMME